MATDDQGKLSARNHYIEALRVVSAFLIVWYHSGMAGHAVAYAGLPAFVCISTFLEALRDPARRLALGATALRLGVPWLVWSLVFLGIDLAHHDPIFAAGAGPVGAVLYGTSGHLWYLPFILFMVVAIRLLVRAAGLKAIAIGASVTTIALLALIPWWRPASIAMGPPLAQYLHALTPACFGIVLAAADRRLLPTYLAVLLTGGMAVTALLPFPGVGLPYLFGCGAVLAAVLRQRRAALPAGRLPAIAGLTFGIYLVHRHSCSSPTRSRGRAGRSGWWPPSPAR